MKRATPGRSFGYDLFGLSGEGGQRLLKGGMDVEIFRLVSPEALPISKFLEKSGKHAVPGTILHYLCSLYQNAGWEKPTTKKTLGPCNEVVLEPLLELPSIEYHLFYTVLGLSSVQIESFFKECKKDFNLSLILLDLCRDFGKDIGKCFPSLCFEVSNREKQIERSESRTKVRESLQQEEMDGRIIPVCSLPLVLSRLPDFYQEVNITLAQCELLERTIWSTLEVRKFDKFVKKQLEQMKHNRRFLNFQNQVVRQSRFDPQVDRYEFLLKEAELFFTHLYEADFRERNGKMDRKMERGVKKIKLGKGKNGKEY